jgi:RNA polymerase sigma-70 factor (ECF subfamily)
VRNYGGRMLAVARRLLRSEEDAADAVQEAFLSALVSLNQFQGGSHVYTWLHRIVVNKCLFMMRGQKRRPCLQLDGLLPEFDCHGRHACAVAPWDNQATSRLERQEVQAVVRECIDQLPDGYRTILILRDIEELDTGETAALLGVSKSLAKTRLHRARQALRTLLERSALAQQETFGGPLCNREQVASQRGCDWHVGL